MEMRGGRTVDIKLCSERENSQGKEEEDVECKGGKRYEREILTCGGEGKSKCGTEWKKVMQM